MNRQERKFVFYNLPHTSIEVSDWINVGLWFRQECYCFTAILHASVSSANAIYKTTLRLPVESSQ